MKKFKVCLSIADEEILKAVKSMAEHNFTLVEDAADCNVFLTDNYTLKNKRSVNILIVNTLNIPQFKGINDLEGFSHYVIFSELEFLEERAKRAIIRHWKILQGQENSSNIFTGVNALISLEESESSTGVKLPIIREFKVTSSRERKTMADALEKFFEEIESSSGYKNPVAIQYALEMQEELLMNAIWDANPKHATKPRSEPIELIPSEEITLQWAFNGKELAISVRDPFGRLNPAIMEKYVNYIFKTGKQNEHKLSEQKISAGLGMYMLIQRANLLSVFVSQGKITDVGVVLILSSGRRSKSLIPKAIDIIQV